MKLLTASTGVAVAAAIAIAGCGSTSPASTSSASSAGKTVATEQIGGAGTVLVDSSGMALYSPAQEKGGTIMCTGSCTSIWKPLTISSGKPTGAGNLGVVKRPDGTRQVTAGGLPLYTFVQDQAGQVTGNGASDSFGGHSFTWHVITSKGAAAGSSGKSSRSGASAYSYGSY